MKRIIENEVYNETKDYLFVQKYNGEEKIVRARNLTQAIVRFKTDNADWDNWYHPVGRDFEPNSIHEEDLCLCMEVAASDAGYEPDYGIDEKTMEDIIFNNFS